MNGFASLLVQNLKALNAKERDHLMRFAYLGSTAPWLSKEMICALKKQLPGDLGPDAKCVFAGMDYHLDWLHAALYLAHKDTSVEKACKDGLKVDMAERGNPADAMPPSPCGRSRADRKTWTCWPCSMTTRRWSSC